MAKSRKPKGQYSEEIFPSSLGKMSRKKKLNIDLQSENVCVPQPSLLGEHGRQRDTLTNRARSCLSSHSSIASTWNFSLNFYNGKTVEM